MSISSATQSGSKPWYLEECSSTLATTYSSGSPASDQNIVTVDMDTTYKKSLERRDEPVTQYLCTLSHTGTSASAPIAAGIVALALEANPYLTWRDMQHLVVLTSRYDALKREPGWQTNAVGRRFSHKFGYGLMDASAMVRLAKNWKNVPAQRVCESESVSSSKDAVFQIPADDTILDSRIFTVGCKGTSNEIRYLEHVQATITLKFHPRGNLKITLTSPSGTSSNLLLPRTRDSEDDVIQNWPFLSVHFWGESPEGNWKLSIQNMGNRADKPGVLLSWSLTFYGTLEKPTSSATTRNISFHHLPRRTYLVTDEDRQDMSECAKSGQFSLPGSTSCLEKCPKGYFGDTANGICQKCNSICETCYGPSSEHCLSCFNGTFYHSDRCLTDCPNGYYNDKQLFECLPCSSNCRTCSNSPKHCSSCASHLILDQASSTCIPRCRSTNDCKCHSSCTACSGPSDTECISCPINHRLIDGKCIEGNECPDGYFEVKSPRFSSSECSKCHDSCRTCKGPSHSDCLECNDSFTRINGLCSHCAPGQYLDRSSSSTSGKCASCHDSCFECEGPNENQCTQCIHPTFLQQGSCMPCCPSSHSNSSPDQPSNCCNCLTENGPCTSQPFPRSITNSEYSTFKKIASSKETTWSKAVILGAVVACCAFIFVVFIVAFKSLKKNEQRGKRYWSDISLFSTKSKNDLGYKRLNLDDIEEDSLFQRT